MYIDIYNRVARVVKNGKMEKPEPIGPDSLNSLGSSGTTPFMWGAPDWIPPEAPAGDIKSFRFAWRQTWRALGAIWKEWLAAQYVYDRGHSKICDWVIFPLHRWRHRGTPQALLEEEQ
jgi:hypothetical protein